MQLPQLADFAPKIRKKENQIQIFDPCRKKYVSLTPEEKVRQYFLHFLVTIMNIPLNHIITEYSIKINKTQKRADIVVFNNKKEIEILVECKAPEIKLSEEVLQQIATYNIEIQAKKLFVTNGNEYFEFGKK